MDSATDIEAIRREAASSLQYYWEAAEYDTPEDLEDDEAEVREACSAIQEDFPDDIVGSVCLTLLELGRLRAHLNDEISTANDHFDDEYNPPAGLDEDDQHGRALAAEVVRAAERTLALQETNNLAVFSRACGLHWMGDHDAAAAAYREALRLDPYDHIAKARIEQLENIELPEPPSGLTTHHPHGFHLLEMTHLVGHSGSTKGWVWLLSDPSSVRSSVDGYLDAWLANCGLGLDDEFSVLTHVPNSRREGYELREALGRTAEGQTFIDWSKVPLPDLGRSHLPVGQPIRWLGQLHFFGGTEHDD